MNLVHWWRVSDAVMQTAALVLFAMSVASWVVMVWKLRLVLRARGDTVRSLAGFWSCPDWPQADASVRAADREKLVLPLVDAAAAARSANVERGAVDFRPTSSVHATRLLRAALAGSTARLQSGLAVLATIGATAPFVGLLGTVWGIHHALAAMAGAGQISVERLAGPVGEALIMTAAGLAVALPAVLGYNGFGRVVAGVEAELEGFAQDLLGICTGAG